MPRKIHASSKKGKYKFGQPYITYDYKVYRNKESIPYLTRDKQVPYKVCEDFVDPITLQYFIDPVLAADNKIYERAEIQRWLLTHDRSPLTREVIRGPNVRGLIGLPQLAARMNTIKAMCPPISHGRDRRGDIQTWADAERVVQTNKIAREAALAADARETRQIARKLLADTCRTYGCRARPLTAKLIVSAERGSREELQAAIREGRIAEAIHVPARHPARAIHQERAVLEPAAGLAMPRGAHLVPGQLVPVQLVLADDCTPPRPPRIEDLELKMAQLRRHPHPYTEIEIRRLAPLVYYSTAL